jgi:hypothetical protein
MTRRSQNRNPSHRNRSRNSADRRLDPLPRSIEWRTGSRNPNATDFFFLRAVVPVTLDAISGTASYAFTTNLVTSSLFPDLTNLSGFYQEQMVTYLKVTWIPVAWLVNGTGDTIAVGAGSKGAGMYMAASNANTLPSLTPDSLIMFQNCKFRPVGQMLTHTWRNPRTGTDASFYAVGAVMPQFGGVYFAYASPATGAAQIAGEAVVECGIVVRTRI